MTFRKLKKEARFLAIVALAVLAVIVDSTLYILSFIEDGVFMAALIWLAWGFVKDASSTDAGKEG